MLTYNQIQEALLFIPADLPRDEWVRIAKAIKSEVPDGFQLFNEWSKGGATYKINDCKSAWRSIKIGGGVSVGTLFYEAKKYGYKLKYENNFTSCLTTNHKSGIANNQNLIASIEDTARRSNQTWQDAKPANPNHLYLKKKNIKPLGMGMVGSNYLHLPKCLKGKGRVLVIPLYDLNGKIWCIQFIPEEGDKAFIYGSKKSEIFYRIGEESSVFWIVEGIATGGSVYTHTNQTVYCAFTAYALLSVATALRRAYPEAKIKIMADDDWFTPENTGLTKAKMAAKAINAQVFIPNFDGLSREPQHTDFNDWVCLSGVHHGCN